MKSSTAVEENSTKMKAEDERMLSDFNRQADELKLAAAKLGADTPTKAPPGVQELVSKWEIMKMRIPDLIQRGMIREAHDELKTIQGTLKTTRSGRTCAPARGCQMMCVNPISHIDA